MPAILILSEHAQAYTQLIAQADLPGAQLVQAGQPLSGCEIVFGEPNLVRPLLDQLPDLRWVQATWAGVEPLLEPGLRRDYLLTNARGVFGGLMAEYILGYLLLHERKMLLRYEAQKQARWEPALTGTLRGRTLGLLGVGSIGAEVARAAKFFGMTVLGYTQSSEDCREVDIYFHGEGLLDFARRLDYLVSILPGTAATRGMIDSALLAQLPPHALVINAGRGSAVDEPALLRALESGRLAGAVLDVFNQEPLPPDHPFWHAPNLLITSHTAAPSFPADIARLFSENYRRYLNGEPLKYQVDFAKGY